MYNPKSMHAEEFINDGEILGTLEYAEANKENYELIKDILDTKILKLEDIKIKAQEFPDDKNIIVFDIYDNDILDKQIAYDTYDNKKIEIKLKRMMKLFN